MPLTYSEKMGFLRSRYHELKKTVEVCALCPDLVCSRKLAPYGKATYGYGRLDSRTMFVGEAPGLHGCATTGIPFTKDRSGQYYQWILKYLGLTMKDVYTTNIVKCWPKDPDGMKNRTPTTREVSNCFPHLMNEINLVQPKNIVCLGRVPEKILKSKLARRIDYIPHPAYMLRRGIHPGSKEAKAYAKKYAKFIKQASIGERTKMDDFIG